MEYKKQKSKWTCTDSNNSLALGISLGVAVGTAIGVATDNIGIWLALGPALGLILVPLLRK
jgi:hypothetical protein